MDSHALVYFPKIDTTTIDDFRQKYDPMFGIIPPHITIVFPFTTIPKQMVLEHVEMVLQKIEPFPLHLHSLTKSFDNYLFLLVEEGKKQIYALHDLLYTSILTPELKNDIPFIPHITLGLFQNDNTKPNSDLYTKAYKEAEKANFDIHCTFDTITLIKGDGIKPAQVVHTFSIT